MFFTPRVLHKAAKDLGKILKPLSVSSSQEIPKLATKGSKKMRATVVMLVFGVGTALVNFVRRSFIATTN